MEESYDFCNNLDHYITRESWMSSGSNSLQYKYNCMFSFVGNIREGDLENLCANFKNLYSQVFSPFGHYATRNDEDIEYMNYWLNKKLKNEEISNISPTEFYQKLTYYDSLFDTEKRLKGKIHDINAEDLEKMNKLYDMYVIYYNIKTTSYTDKKNCNLHSTECVQKFTEAIKSCSDYKNDKYCKALKTFKKKYDDFNGDNRLQGCKKDYLLKLPPLEEENEHSATTTESAANTSEQEAHPALGKDQHLVAKNDVEGERKESPNLIHLSLSTAGENNSDNNINIFTIFGIILSISVFSIITYKVKYITYKNNNI